MSATVTETSVATDTKTQTFQPTSSSLSNGEKNTSNSSSYILRGTVTARLNFFADPADGSKPHNWVEIPTDGRPQRNFGDNYLELPIHDIRGHESDFHLEKDAFQTAPFTDPTQTVDFNDDESVKTHYYPAVTDLLLKNVPGAHKVTLFDHTVRRADPNAPRAPVQRVHVDQTARSTEWRVRLHDPDNAEELLKGRYRIINVWKPISGPVQSFPLAYASADTVDDDDLVPVEHRYPHRIGETAGVRYGEGQKFFYWSGMDTDEAVFLKCFDSKDKDDSDGRNVGRRVPHTAFVDPRTPEGARPRESIEVRALVYG